MTRRQFVLANAASAEGGRLAGAHDERPNIVIYMPDQLRAESIGCYGHPLVKTPNIDRFAAAGIRFTHCMSAYPICTAARCSLLTGWPPHVRGHRTAWHLLHQDEPNLFRYLRRGGYDVFWFGKNDVLRHECFADSVTEWNSFTDREEWDSKENPWPRESPFRYSFLFREGRDRRAYPDYARVQAAIRIMERGESQRPFCIFLPLFFPHPPYSGPAGFHDLYKPADIPPLRPPALRGKPKQYEAVRRSRRLDRLSEADLRQINSVYLGMVSYADWLFGVFLEAVEKSGRARQTAIIFCSDHGDWAGDYGLVEKWSNAADDTLLHVPLVIRTPGMTKGGVVTGMCELADLMPTCLEWAQVRSEHPHFARSLVPQLKGARGDAERAAFSEGGYNANEPQAFEPMLPEDHIYYPKVYLENTRPDLITRTTVMRTADFKLVLRPDGDSELYDLSVDARELDNVYNRAPYRDQQAKMESRMLAWYARTAGVVVGPRDDRSLPVYPQSCARRRWPSWVERVMSHAGSPSPSSFLGTSEFSRQGG
jgi:choline-sulfatase